VALAALAEVRNGEAEAAVKFLVGLTRR
jgi:hypothetical protein